MAFVWSRLIRGSGEHLLQPLAEGDVRIGQEMAIAVEDAGNAGVPGTNGDLLDGSTTSDPEADGGMAEVMQSQRVNVDGSRGRQPEALAEGRCS